jgi:hypothetical protein
MGTWLKRAAVALVASSALAGGMVAASASPASAAVAKKDCTYAGETYSHGAIIVISEGLHQQCDNGVWKVWTPKPPEPRD